MDDKANVTLKLLVPGFSIGEIPSEWNFVNFVTRPNILIKFFCVRILKDSPLVVLCLSLFFLTDTNLVMKTETSLSWKLWVRKNSHKSVICWYKPCIILVDKSEVLQDSPQFVDARKTNARLTNFMRNCYPDGGVTAKIGGFINFVKSVYLWKIWTKNLYLIFHIICKY